MNKKINKIGLLAVGVSTTFVLGMANVKAISIGSGPVNGYLGYDQSGILLVEETGTYKMTLDKDVAHDIEIKAGEKVIIDLNGKNLTNYTSGLATIYVEPGAQLTIIGEGTVTQKVGSNGAVVANKGTLIIEGGTFEAINVGNHAILNEGALTINGGQISTGATNVFGLANFGTANITGGTFTQKYNYSVINNLNQMNITGGTFKISDGNTAAYSLITNEAVDEDVNASLNISGGNFNGNKGIFYNKGEDKIAITGGKFIAEDTTDLVAYLDGNSKLNEAGELVPLEEADYTKVEEALAKVENLNKDEYTPESYEALENAINNVVRGLKENNQAEVDNMASSIEKAITGLQKIEELTQKPNEEPKEDKPQEPVAQETPKGDTNVPNTADVRLTYKALSFVSLLGIGVASIFLKKRR